MLGTGRAVEGVEGERGQKAKVGWGGGEGVMGISMYWGEG